MTAVVDVFLVLVGSSLFRQEWWLLHTLHARISISGTTFLLICGALMVYLSAREVRHAFRDHNLLSEGDVTLGEVVDVKSGHRGSRIIQYKLVDASDRVVTGSSYDFSRALVAGDRIPVFFDCRKPNKMKVPLCGAYWEIAFPPGQAPSLAQKGAAWRSWFRS